MDIVDALWNDAHALGRRSQRMLSEVATAALRLAYEQGNWPTEGGTVSAGVLSPGCTGDLHVRIMPVVLTDAGVRLPHLGVTLTGKTERGNERVFTAEVAVTSGEQRALWRTLMFHASRRQ